MPNLQPSTHNQQPLWGFYERLRPAQIEAIRHATPVAYIPWGALEWHSYHNPIGLDGMQAHGQCAALARETGGIVLPPFYIGTDTIKPFKGFPHSIEYSAGVVGQLCRELLEQLRDENFNVIVIVTGHCGAGHTDILQQTVDLFTEEHPGTHVKLIPSFAPTQDTYPSNHAALGETSYQMLYDPELVDLSLLPEDRVATLDEDGVWGDDPRGASAEKGTAIERLFVERAVLDIQRLL